MSNVSIKFKGVLNLTNNMRRSANGAQSGASKACRKVTKEILSESKALCPVETGSLKASGRLVEDFADRNSSFFAITYGSHEGIRDSTQYAVYVHEDLSKKHPVGQAKFLEIPWRAGMARLNNAIREEVRLEWGKELIV